MYKIGENQALIDKNPVQIIINSNTLSGRVHFSSFPVDLRW